jgi:hypothetical protein
LFLFLCGRSNNIALGSCSDDSLNKTKADESFNNLFNRENLVLNVWHVKVTKDKLFCPWSKASYDSSALVLFKESSEHDPNVMLFDLPHRNKKNAVHLFASVFVCHWGISCLFIPLYLYCYCHISISHVEITSDSGTVM